MESQSTKLSIYIVYYISISIIFKYTLQVSQSINMYIQIYTNAKYVHGYISSISHKWTN